VAIAVNILNKIRYLTVIGLLISAQNLLVGEGPATPQPMPNPDTVIAPENGTTSDNLATDWLALDQSNKKPERISAESSKIWSPNENVSIKAAAQLWTEAECNSLDRIDCDNTSQGSAYKFDASWQPLDQFSLSLGYSNIRLQSANNLLSNDGKYLYGETLSEDLNLSCDINTGAFGELALGLQLSRLESGLGLGSQAQLGEFYQQAVVDVGWSKGAFSGGLTSRMLDRVQAGQNGETPWTTFDINFAWRMPWNARLSVGAKNLLDQAAPDENGLNSFDLESRLGRIPYVRYQQDL